MKPATDLISVNRLDVFSKTPLAYAWLHELDDTWGTELYKAYMLATRPPKGYSEDNTKFSIKDYLTAYRSLFESLRMNGFDESISSIPVGNQGITNGSHRLAASLVLGEKVSQTTSTDLDHNYNFRFMQSVGMSENLIEATVLEFLEYSKRSTVFCALGISSKLALEIESHLNNSNFKIIYVKALNLSKIGQRRMMKILYGFNQWWSPELYETLSIERFSEDKTSYFFFVESKLHQEEVSYKAQIRNLFFKNNHKQFHSTDNKQETLRLGECVLNQNSLLVLNEAPIESEQNIIELIKKNPYLRELNPKHFAIDGSANLEIFGIRKAKDLDFIQTEKKFSESAPLAISHNSEYEKMPISPTLLIIDPRNHAIIDGYKFVNVPQTISFKAHRGENKDLIDIVSLSNRKYSGSVYGDSKSRRSVMYLRFRTVLRRRVNKIISPLPQVIQVLIRKVYVYLREILS